MSPIEKAKDIIAKGEPCQMVTNTADPRVPISYRRAVSPANLLPLLRLLVECEPVLESAWRVAQGEHYYALASTLDALLDKLRKDQ